MIRLHDDEDEFDDNKVMIEWNEPYKNYKKPLNNSFDNYKDPAENNPEDDDDSTSCYEDDDDDICDCEDCTYCRLKEQTLCGDPFAFEAYGTYPVFDNNGIECGDIEMPKKIIYSVSPSSIIRYENCMFDIFPCQFFVNEYGFTGKVKIVLKHEWGYKTISCNIRLNSNGKPMQYHDDEYNIDVEDAKLEEYIKSENYVNILEGLCSPSSKSFEEDENQDENQDEDQDEDQYENQDENQDEDQDEDQYEEISVGPSLRALGYKNSSLKKLAPDVYQLKISSEPAKAKTNKNQVISNYWLRSNKPKQQIQKPNKNQTNKPKPIISNSTFKKVDPKKNQVISNYNLRPRNNNIDYNVNITKILYSIYASQYY
jgi:hypothetical protein